LGIFANSAGRFAEKLWEKFPAMAYGVAAFGGIADMAGLTTAVTRSRMTRLGHGHLSQFFDVWWLIAGGSVAQRPFGTAPLIGVKDPCRISLHTNTGQEEIVVPVDSILFSRRDCRIGL
jgi:hypothetical protein